MRRESSQKYGRQTHLNAVLAATGAKYTALDVLRVMCWESRFDKPQITCTTEQLMEKARRGRTKVKEALRLLRSEGTIKYVANEKGGRGNAVTWQICLPKNAKLAAPAAAASDAPAEGIWPEICEHFAAAEPNAWRSFVSKLEFAAIDGSILRLVAPNSFIAAHSQTHLVEKILPFAAVVDQSIRRIEITAE